MIILKASVYFRRFSCKGQRPKNSLEPCARSIPIQLTVDLLASASANADNVGRHDLEQWDQWNLNLFKCILIDSA